MDRIFIEGLSLRGKHGVNEHERHVEQKFLVDISARCDTKVASASDDLADTIDYSNFAEVAKSVVEQNSFYLIERLADSIARKILEDVRILEVSVTVRKPAAIPNGKPGVTIVRANV